MYSTFACESRGGFLYAYLCMENELLPERMNKVTLLDRGTSSKI